MVAAIIFLISVNLKQKATQRRSIEQRKTLAKRKPSLYP